MAVITNVRKLKYQMTFADRMERSCIVNIYKEGYVGEVIQLTGGATPFTTQEDTAEDILSPIRTTTGHLSVIDEGNLGELYAENEQDLYVEMLRDSVLQWRGYLVPETQSQDWMPQPMEMALNIVSPVETLKSVNLSQSKDMTTCTLAELLVECIKAMKAEVDNIYYPKDWLQTDSDTDYSTPLRMVLSRYSFFSLNDADNKDDVDYEIYDADTCYVYLKKLCTFWGWILKEDRRDLYFIQPGNDTYISMNYNELLLIVPAVKDLIDTIPEVMANTKSFSDLTLAGNDNKIDRLPGHNKFRVVSDLKKCDNPVPSLDRKDFNPFKWYRYVQWIIGEDVTIDDTDILWMLLYELHSIDGKVQMEMHVTNDANSSKTKFYENWADAYAAAIEGIVPSQFIYRCQGFTFVKIDSFKSSEVIDTKNPKVNFNFTDGIMYLPMQYPSSNAMSVVSNLMTKDLLVMHRNISAIYDRGAFAIQATAYGYTYQAINPSMAHDKHSLGIYLAEEKQTEEITANIGKHRGFYFKLRIGQYWWSGSAWTTTEQYFFVETQDGTTNGTGTQSTIKTTKTLNDPYNGLTGYMIKIPTDFVLEGDIELRLRVPSVQTNNADASIWASNFYPIIIENLKVSYYKYDGDTDVEDKSQNRYIAKVDNLFKDELDDVELHMLTDKDNPSCYNKLGIYDRATKKIISPQQLYSVKNAKLIKPELALLGMLKQLYARIMTKVTLEIEQDGTILPWTKLTLEGKTYWIAARYTDWKDAMTDIIIYEV